MSIVTNLRYTANLDKGVTMTPITPSFMGGDQEAHRFVVDCYRQNSREAVDLSGAGVTAYFLRADGVTIPMVGEAEGNTASVLLPAACYAVQGRFSLAVKLSLDDGTADSINTIFWGEGAVSRSRTDVVIDPDSVIPSLEELLAQIEAMEQATENATAAAQTANQAATDATSTANAAAASAQATAEAAATQAVEIATAKGDEAVQVATDKGNEAVQIATEQVEAQNQAIAKIATDLLTKAPAIECEASGSLVTVTDAAAQPAVQLVTHIEPVQEGEGDPSPDNVRPITGWSAVSLWRGDSNLYDGVTFVVGGLNVATGAANNTKNRIYSQFVAVEPGDYVITARKSLRPGRVHLYTDADESTWTGSVLLSDTLDVGSVCATGSFTVAEACYIRVLYTPEDTTLESVTLDMVNAAEPMLYANPATLAAALPETVYGGTVDWASGVLTVDRACLSFDGMESWVEHTNTYGNARYYCKVNLPPTADLTRQICSHYPIKATATNSACAAVSASVGAAYIVPDTAQGLTTVDAWVAYLAAQSVAGTPVQMCYEITAPYTVQLTPQQLEMLRGTNNLWSDTGDTDLVYVADTKLYIDQAIKAALQPTTEE